MWIRIPTEPFYLCPGQLSAFASACVLSSYAHDPHPNLLPSTLAAPPLQADLSVDGRMSYSGGACKVARDLALAALWREVLVTYSTAMRVLGEVGRERFGGQPW
jgi:hypothetical protein